MFRPVFAAACLLALLAFGEARPVRAQANPDATQLALRYLEALEAGQWDKAQAMMDPGVGSTPEKMQKYWTGSAAKERGEARDWHGTAVEEWTDGTTTDVFIPALRTGGKSGFRITVEGGLIRSARPGLSYAMFGPYAFFPGRGYVYPDGSVARYYRTLSGDGLGTELRGPDGRIRIMEVIKATTPGTLIKLRNVDCPADICGQMGTVADGVVSWREPKASGGHVGLYMDAKIWFEGDELVSHTTDPAPLGDLFIRHPELLPQPTRATLVNSPPMTDAQRQESRLLVAQMESQVEAQVAQALQGQSSRAQAIADDNAKRQRSSERVRAFNRAMEGMNGALTAANEVATENAARSQAELDATIAQMNYQAAQQRQQQNSAQASARPAAAVQAPQAPQQVASSSPSAPAGASEASASPVDTSSNQPAAAKSPGGTMTFILLATVDAIINGMNGNCYSNLVSIPGPPGWPLLDHTNDHAAAEMVEAHMSGFKAQCSQAGPVDSTSYVWNARGSEGRPAEEFARHQRNRMFKVQVSP